MDRRRVDQHYSPTTFFRPGTPFMGGGYSIARTQACIEGVGRSSDITDDPTSPSSRLAKRCNHVSIMSSRVSGSCLCYYIHSPAPTAFDLEFDMHLSPPGYWPECGAGFIDWNEMVSDLSRQVNGRLITKSLLLVSLFELAKTYQMVRNPFGLLRGDWRKVVGRFPIRKLVTTIPNFWLEKKYGWDCLFYDINNFIDSVKKVDSAVKSNPSSQSRRTFAVRRMVYNPTPPLLGFSNGDLATMRADSQRIMENNTHDGICHAAMRLRGTSDTTMATVSTVAADDPLQDHMTLLRKFTSAFGVDLQGCINTIWEIVPFSFVVDWFVDIKRFMRPPMAQMLQSQGIYNICHSTKRVQDYVGEVYLGASGYEDTEGYPYATIRGDPDFFSGSVGTLTTYERTPGLPTEESILKGNLLSVNQCADGLMLLTQLGSNFIWH